MKLTEYDIELILNLVKINKVILKRYKQAKVTTEKRRVANNILPLIRMEKDLLASLNINEEKFALIRRYFEGKAGVNPTDLLYGTQSSMTDLNYAYYRIIAKLKYLVEKDHPNIFKNINAYLTDYEVNFLYRNLLQAKTEKESIKKGLEHYAYMILMNSPEIEEKILENGFEPFEETYDSIDIMLDYKVLEGYKKVKSQLEGPLLASKYRSSDNIRIRRFTSTNMEISAEIMRYVSIYKTRPENAAYTKMLITYFKTMVALLEPKRREEIYQLLFSDESLSKEAFEYLKDMFKDIEIDLVPKVTSLSLIPTKSL